MTPLFAPTLLNRLTDNGTHLEGWRQLPVYYAIMLATMSMISSSLREQVAGIQ